MIDIKYKAIAPPLGATPSYIELPSRIDALSKAISRYSNHQELRTNTEVTKSIKVWALEIVGHCDTIEKLREVQ